MWASKELTYDQFKQWYVTQFLATWAATHYDDYCLRSKQNELKDPPVEDAEWLAEAAWERLQLAQIKL